MGFLSKEKLPVIARTLGGAVILMVLLASVVILNPNTETWHWIGGTTGIVVALIVVVEMMHPSPHGGKRPPPASKDVEAYLDRASMAATQFKRAIAAGERIDWRDINVRILFWDFAQAHFTEPPVMESGYTPKTTFAHVIERVRGLTERYFFPQIEKILREQDADKRARLVFAFNQVLKAAMFNGDGLIYYVELTRIFQVAELPMDQRKLIDDDLEARYPGLGFAKYWITVGEGKRAKQVSAWGLLRTDGGPSEPPPAPPPMDPVAAERVAHGVYN